MADRLLLILALRDGAPIAGALNLIGAEALYGRYWGALEEVPFLHFELCYYQAIDAAIARGLAPRRGRRAGRAQAGARLSAGADLLRPLSSATRGFRATRSPTISPRERARGRPRDRRARRNDPLPQRLRRQIVTPDLIQPSRLTLSARISRVTTGLSHLSNARLSALASFYDPAIERRGGHAEIPRAGDRLLWPARPPPCPPAGPERAFTAARPVRPRGGVRSADQPGRALDRLCPPLGRHHDRPLPPLDLADRHRAPARRCRSRRGASQPRWSPDGDRLAYIAAAEGGRAQLFVRWMATGQAVAITGLPDSPSSVAWSPDGRQLAYAMFVPDEGARLGPPQPRPEGAQWAEPLQVITAVTYRADGQGYLRAGYDQLFLVSSEGGAPRQFSYGPYNDGGPLSWTPRRPHPAVQRQPLARTGSARASTAKSMRSTSPSTQISALTNRDGPGRRAGGVARRPADRLHRL